MPQELHGNCITIRTGIETWVINHPQWFELVHDGSIVSEGRRPFFTKMYAVKYKGGLVGVGVKFVYDYRTGLADVTLDDVVVRMFEASSKEYELSQVSAYENTRKRFSAGVIIGLASILIGVAILGDKALAGYSLIFLGLSIDAIFQYQLSRIDKLDRDSIIKERHDKLEQHEQNILELAIANGQTKKGVI